MTQTLKTNYIYPVQQNNIHQCARLGNIEEINKFILPFNINTKDENGDTPLHHAVTKINNIPMIQLLINSNADPNIVNNNGETPLHIVSDDYDAALILLNASADPNIIDKNGSTLLHYAVHDEHLEIIALLLEFGADPNIRNNEGNFPCDYTDDEYIINMLKNDR